MSDLSSSTAAIYDQEMKGQIKRNIILLSLGQFVSLFGTSIYTFAISLYILSVTGSGLSFSLTLVLGSLPRVLFGAFSGVLADRVDRKKTVVLFDIISGILVMGLLALSLLDEFRLTYIYVTTLLLSACNVFFTTALSSSIPKIVDDQSLTRINSLNYTIMSLSTIAGPFIGGLVYALIDIRVFLLINGLSFIFSGISELFINFNIHNKKTEIELEEIDTRGKQNGILLDLKEGFQYMRTQQWLLIIGSFAVFFNMFIMIGLTIPLPYIVREVWGFTSKQFGILNMMFPVGALIGSLILSMLPEAEKNYRRMIVSLFILSITVLTVGLITSETMFTLNNFQYLIILMIFYMITAMSAVFINVPISVTMQRYIPGDKLGRVTGTLGTLAMALSPLDAIIAGTLVDLIIPWILPVSCGIIMLFIIILMSRSSQLKGL